MEYYVANGGKHAVLLKVDVNLIFLGKHVQLLLCMQDVDLIRLYYIFWNTLCFLYIMFDDELMLN